MNRAQRIILLVGMVAFLVSCLIVPYIGYKSLSAPAFIGYNWFHNPPASGLGSTNIYVEIDLTRLFLEWGVILIVTAAALLLNGSKKVRRNRRSVSIRRFGARAVISWAGTAVRNLWPSVKTNPGLALTWGVVALLIATACVLPTTTTYKQHTGSLLDKYRSEVPYDRVAYPFQVVVLETLAILLAGAAVSFLLWKTGIDRKLKITWLGAGFLIAVLLLFPPMRVYDSEATSRIVESRRSQNMHAWEKLINMSFGDSLARSATLVRHKIGKGETMWEIAKQYRISIQALKDANNLSENYRLTVGQTLLIPVPQILGPSELIYRNAHTPVWLSSAPDIRLVQLDFEIGVVLFLSTAISVLILRGSRYRKSPPVSET